MAAECCVRRQPVQHKRLARIHSYIYSRAAYLALSDSVSASAIADPRLAFEPAAPCRATPHRSVAEAGTIRNRSRTSLRCAAPLLAPPPPPLGRREATFHHSSKSAKRISPLLRRDDSANRGTELGGRDGRACRGRA